MDTLPPRGRIIRRLHHGPPLDGLPVVFVVEHLASVLLQTVEVETRSGEIVCREVVDQFSDGMRIQEIVLDPIRALEVAEEMRRQALRALPPMVASASDAPGPEWSRRVEYLVDPTP